MGCHSSTLHGDKQGVQPTVKAKPEQVIDHHIILLKFVSRIVDLIVMNKIKQEEEKFEEKKQ